MSVHSHPCVQCAGPVKNAAAKLCRSCYVGPPTAETKACAVCKEAKALTEFKPRPAYRYGVNSVCRKCDAKARRDLYHRNPQKERDRGRAFHLLSQYGLTPEQHDAMSANGCHICGEACKTGRRLAVDHCHSTGRVRGVLCANCNRAIGLFGDDAERLKKAFEYLTRLRG